MRALTVTVLRRLAAEAQLGLVTRAQVTAASATASWLRTQIRVGSLRQLEADVFVLTDSFEGVEPPWHVEALAACLQRGPDARLGFATAARIWGLAEGQNATSDPLHVVVPVGQGCRNTNRVQVHRTKRLTTQDVAVFGYLPVTTVARTLLDLAASLTSTQVERAVDDALVRELTTVPLLTGALRRNAHRGCTGSTALRAALALWNVGAVESHAEAEVLRWLLAAGVPEPVRQLEITTADGKRLRVDFAWVAARVVLEVDGFAHHHGPRKLSADHERRSFLASQGWHVLTTTMAEVRRGGGQLLAALRRLRVLA
ncbi:MAG: DUF559 domain-containing protein [Acidimicrobiales bacterium]